MLWKCSWLSQIQPKRNCPNLIICVWDTTNSVVQGSMSIYLPSGSRELIFIIMQVTRSMRGTVSWPAYWGKQSQRRRSLMPPSWSWWPGSLSAPSSSVGRRRACSMHTTLRWGNEDTLNNYFMSSSFTVTPLALHYSPTKGEETR